LADFTFVVFSEDEAVANAIGDRLEATGHVTVVGTIEDPERIVEALEQAKPNGVFADLGRAPHVVLDALRAIPTPRPQLIVCGPQDDPRLLLRAMKQGIREYLSPDLDSEELSDAVARTVLERGYDRVGKPAGRVVAVMGAKGGVGATFVTTQLAASLQARGGRSVVMDLNYPLGDVALHLDVHPQHTLADVARQGSSLDAVFLKSALERHQSGVQVLAAPNRLEDAELLTGECVDQSLQLLRNDFDWVLIDASRSWNDANSQAFAWADQILLVACLDVPTLNHAKQHVDLFKRLGHSDERIRVVLNRFSSWDTVTQSDFADFVARAPDMRIPNDYATAANCLNQGRTVAEIAAAGPLHRAFIELARGMYDWCGLESKAGGSKPAGDNLKARLRRMLGGR